MQSRIKSRQSVRHAILDDADAFTPDTTRGAGPLTGEAEALAQEFVAAATSAADIAEDARDEFVSEELGGPFLELDVEDGLGGWFAASYNDDERVET